jgi:protein phosphatase
MLSDLGGEVSSPTLPIPSQACDPLRRIRATSSPMPPLHWSDLRGESGAYDVLGDVHSCAEELEALMRSLGYDPRWAEEGGERVARVDAPRGRKLILAGDLIDRGPKSADALRLAMAIVGQGHGYVVMGNHDLYLAQWMRGANLPINPGIAQTLDQLSRESEGFLRKALALLSSLPTYLWLDGGKLCVCHAGMREHFIGQGTPEAHDHAINGDEPLRNATKTYDSSLHWSSSYSGETTILYGHFRIQEALWVNNTMCLDTACVYGGKLTALRWPERELVSVPAQKRYTYARARDRCIPPGTLLFS